MTWLLSIGRALLKHPLAVLLAIGGAVAWIYRATLRRKIAAARAQRDTAVLERDAAQGRAEVAEATTAVTVEAAKEREAGAVLAEEIRDVPTAGEPADRIRAIDDRVREIARREGAAPDRDHPAAVPVDGAADPARGRRPR